MPEKAPDFRIAPSVYEGWEHHTVPHPVEDVVDAILALPPDRRREVPAARRDAPDAAVLPSVWALGFEFCMVVAKDREGRWRRVHVLTPLSPEV